MRRTAMLAKTRRIRDDPGESSDAVDEEARLVGVLGATSFALMETAEGGDTVCDDRRDIFDAM